MNRTSLAVASLLLVISASLTSCEAIGTIFKAGVWTAVIGIGLVVFLILWLVGRSRK